MIISPRVKSLVQKIEETGLLQPYFPELIKTLNENCLSNQDLELNQTPHLKLSYPIDSQGYAQAFDPLHDEKAIRECFKHYGLVVVKNVVSKNIIQESLKEILNKIAALSMNLSDIETYPKDSHGHAILTRGFFELYHDDALAQIRQSLRLYLFHVILWNSPFLWTTFDRVGIKVPSEEGLNLHVDQNPNVHPNFKTIQGVLALVDCPVEQGTFVAVPGSQAHFSQYSQYIKEDYRGEYIPYPKDDYKNLTLQHIALKQGDMVSWDSRLTHANSQNTMKTNRYVVYLSTGKAGQEASLIQKRKEAFHTGLGENVRDAYMHASKKPRFTDEKLINSIRKKEDLSVLGRCLYGFEDYEAFNK